MQHPSIDYSTLSTILSEINCGVVVIEDTGKLVEANQIFCRMTGFSREELIGAGPPHAFWPSQTSWNEIKAEDSGASETVLETKDGRHVPVMVSRSNALPVDGDERAFLVMFNDITERKLAEDAVHESEEKYRAIFNEARDGIVLMDSETGQIVDCNRAFEKQTGRSVERLSSMKIWDVRPPDEREKTKEVFNSIRRTGKGRSSELDFQKPNGEIVPIDFLSRVVTISGKKYIESFTRDITSRKQAEDVLRASEEKYRAIFSEARDGIVLVDGETGDIADCNPAFEKQSGRSLDELRKLKVWDLRPIEEREKSKGLFESVNRTGKGGSSELTLQKPNGDLVPIDSLSRVVTIKGKKYHQAFTRDITLRRKAENAMRANEEKYRAIFSEARDGIVLADSTGKVLDCNPEFEEQTGRSLEELRQMHVWELRPPEEVERARELFKKLKIKGVIDISEQIFQKPNGETVVVELRGRQIQFGDQVYNQALTRDITQRIKTEQALRDSEERYRIVAETYRELFEHSNDGIFVYDVHGKILDVNAKGCEMLGYDKARLLDLRIKRLTAPESTELLAAKLEEMVETGFVRFEIDLRRKDGSVFPAEVSGSLVQFTGKKVIQGMVRDITERRETEEVLRQSRRQLRALATRLQMVREEESTSISREIHDELGQKLTVLKMDLSWIQRRLSEASNGQDTDPLRERLVAMVSDVDETIRSVRRIATQLRPIVLDDLGLVGALEWQAKEFQERTGLPCRFECTTDEDLLEPDRATAVFRIFQEILTNVVRHAKAKSVNVDLHSENGTLVMKVDDDGIGISDQDLRGPRALGILGMRERALVCGGSVHVEDGASGGTSVEVRIPLRQ